MQSSKVLHSNKTSNIELRMVRWQTSQTNRIDPKRKAQDELRVLEVLLENNEKALLYSFSGHPTILDASSTLISPDYVGVVAEVLSDYYEHTMFFNAPCGDMSTRYTKKRIITIKLNVLVALRLSMS